MEISRSASSCFGSSLLLTGSFEAGLSLIWTACDIEEKTEAYMEDMVVDCSFVADASFSLDDFVDLSIDDVLILSMDVSSTPLSPSKAPNRASRSSAMVMFVNK